MPNYWLLKSEPEVYSIDDLARDKRTRWEGVRNYQARNFLRNELKMGDLVFFYHSNTEPAGIAGIAEVVREGYPDKDAYNPKSEYFDAKSSPEKPAWYLVDIGFRQKFSRLITLEELKKIKALEGMPLLARGQRLSVQPVSEKHWKIITEIAKR